jgi:FkbH-like protein
MRNLLEYPFDNELLLKKRKSIRKELLSDGTNRIHKKVAVLGGSTTHDIVQIMDLFLLNNGIEAEFYESEYAQYWEDAMFGNEKLDAFQPDIIYIHTSIRNIKDFPNLYTTEDEVGSLIYSTYSHYEQMWKRILSRGLSCIIIQSNFEYPFYRILGNKEVSDIHGKIYFINRLNEMFYQFAREHTNFFINDINYLSASYGLEKWSDPFYWHMYKYSLNMQAIPTLALSITNIIKSIYGKNKKSLILDLDNTLWGGVVGDDGVDNLQIGPETSIGQVYSEFQSYLKELKSIGIMLNVNSKNDEENALAGLKHPDGILKPEDFIIIKANWEPKSKNLIEISREMNILPESLVFIDDNPAEREIVKQQVAGVTVPDIETVEHYINIIDKSGFFEVTNLSDDDIKRNDMYKENIERVKQEQSFADYNDYLKSLNMKGTIKSFESIYISRIAQLTNKSNQFNLTTKRYSQAEIEQVAEASDYIDIYGKLEDKFGDNGVVSIVIGRQVNDICHIDLWIMSCRVLKRNMEFAMMDELVKRCKERGIYTIIGYYYPTTKNNMVREFYREQGFTKLQEDDDGNTKWIFKINENYTNKNNVIKVED